MALTEARDFLQNPEHVRAQRPPAVIYDRPPTYDDPPRPQNTALLTRAALHFEENLKDPRRCAP